MTAGRIDLVIHEKNDVVLDCVFKDADGAVVDITGYAFEVEFLTNDTASGSIATVAGTVVSGPAGTFQFVIPSATTNNWSTRRGVYEIRATDTLGYIRTIGEGQFTYNYWGVA